MKTPRSATADRTTFRFCYRGEGTGNAVVMALDAIEFSGSLPASAGDWNCY